MTIKGLGYINSILESLGFPYEFGHWKTEPVPRTYWTGEYTESEPMTEDGLEESSFLLVGTSNESILKLEEVKNQVKQKTKYGMTDILDDGSGIAVSYGGSQFIPSVELGVFRLQITLNIKEWSCD